MKPDARRAPAARAPATRETLAQRIVYEVGRVICMMFFTVAFRIRRRSRGRLPARGPILLVSNHQSYLDPPIVGVLATNRRLRYVAREGLFRDRIFGGLIRFLGAISIPEDGRPDAASIRAILDALDAGDAVLVFPEGTRTPDGSVQAFKRGVGLLLKRSRCPVAPVGIAGAYEAWPRGQRRPTLGASLALVMGEPISHDELLAQGVDAALNRLRGEVSALHEEAQRRLDCLRCWG